LLDHPDFADQVIPDLARWEDWGVIDRLITLYKQTEDPMKWVRISTINFLRVAAQQEGDVGKKAQAAIDELTQVDPEAARRASLYFALGSLGGAKPPAKKDSAAGADSLANPPSGAGQPPGDSSRDDDPDKAERDSTPSSRPPADQSSRVAPLGPTHSGGPGGRSVSDPAEPPLRSNLPTKEEESLEFYPTKSPALWITITAPLVAFVTLVALEWSILRPGRHRPTADF
jgi:hypothetical protein